MDKQQTQLSKFLSFILRHKPESVGLVLDKEGWASISDVIRCATTAGHPVDTLLIRQVVDNNDKKRFAISADGLSIRAVQGHSTPQVDITWQEIVPPAVLYHGTATRFMDSILRQGLVAQSRQYVHLSADEATATQVGQRHGKPVVLKIKARAMHQHGFTFYQADNGVWLTKSVPVRFIER